MSDFSEKMTDILNYGALNLAMAIGYRNRIFDILEDLNQPVTIKEIAAASALSERYIGEWLGIMVTGKIIELSRSPDGENIYFLPPEHAAFLTRRSGNNNLGVYTQEIPLLTTCAMASVNKGFKTGDGISFSQYPDFQQFMAELANAKHKKVLIQEFLPSVENGKLFGRLTSGIRVCDLGCGQGVALNLMARALTITKKRFVRAGPRPGKWGFPISYTKRLMPQKFTGAKNFPDSLITSVPLIPSMIRATLWKCCREFDICWPPEVFFP
jgi:hypothetical protein